MSGAGSRQPGPHEQHSVADLVKQASEQLSDVVRGEMQLAQAEMKEKGRRAGLGGGMFGGAALMGLLALQALLAAAIGAVWLVLPLWAAALIVFGVLLAVAGVLALMGKKEIKQATPAKPAKAISSVKADVDAIKEGAHR